MKRKIISIFLSVFLLMAYSCSEKIELSHEYIKILMTKKSNSKEGESIFLIVPPAACIPCGNYAVDKAHDIINTTSQVQIIFECFPENYDSFCNKLKIIGIPIHIVEIDTTLQFSKLDSIIFPTIVYCYGGKVKSVEFQNSKNPNAIDNLLAKLKHE